MYVTVFTSVEGADQIVVVKLSLGANLSAEVLDCFWSSLVQRQNFDGRFPSEHLMNGFEDLPHSTLSDPVGNDVRAKVKFGTSCQQLVGLISRDDFHFDKHLSQLLLVDFGRNARVASLGLHDLDQSFAQLFLCYQFTGKSGVAKFALSGAHQ